MRTKSSSLLHESSFLFKQLVKTQRVHPQYMPNHKPFLSNKRYFSTNYNIPCILHTFGLWLYFWSKILSLTLGLLNPKQYGIISLDNRSIWVNSVWMSQCPKRLSEHVITSMSVWSKMLIVPYPLQTLGWQYVELHHTWRKLRESTCRYTLHNLMYFDDIILVCESHVGWQYHLNALHGLLLQKGSR